MLIHSYFLCTGVCMYLIVIGPLDTTVAGLRVEHDDIEICGC